MRLFMRDLAVPPSSATLSVCTLLFFCAFSLPAQEILPAVRTQHLAAAPSQHTLSLDPLTDQELASQALIKDEKTPRTPASFREFGTVQANQVVEPQRLTLRFAAAATLTRIESTPDFKLEQGGSCLEGNSYPANATCTLMVRFTPQGPGRRTAKLAISNSADLTPLFVGLGGTGSAPAISFTPSVITTVPASLVSGAGVFSGATNIATDGGDTLYIADTGHNKIDYINSSGVLNTSLFVPTAPIGIAADPTGAIYYTQSSANFLNVILYPTGAVAYEAGSNGCSIGATCPLSETEISYSNMGALAVDPYGTVFMASQEAVSKLVPSTSLSLNYIPLYAPFDFDYDSFSSPQPLAVDASDTLYYYSNQGSGRNCRISGEGYYNATANVYYPVLIAGGSVCGFSGDGGQARTAEIGKQVGQMTFDNAGNLYFSDTLNQRVRRIDNATGIITTIAGNGAAGYTGDYTPATAATLNNPTGVAVDSQGQVFILSNSATTGTAQVIRKVGTVGDVLLPATPVGNSSLAQTVTISNTGNSTLNFVKAFLLRRQHHGLHRGPQHHQLRLHRTPRVRTKLQARLHLYPHRHRKPRGNLHHLG